MIYGNPDEKSITNLSAAFVATAACACTTTVVEPYFRPADAPVENAYVSPSADFGNYTILLARPLEIYFPENAPAPRQEDLNRMRRIFAEAFLAEIGDRYRIVSEPGPGVMVVIAQLIDLKFPGPGGEFQPGGRLSEVVARGQLTLLMEFQDSLNGQVLARAGEAYEGSATSSTDEETAWTEVQSAATRWARMFRRFLDNNLG